MTETAREIRHDDPAVHLGALSRHATATLEAIWVELRKKASDPDFRSDPAAPNPYQRYDALDAFTRTGDGLRATCTKEVVEGIFISRPRAGDSDASGLEELELLDSASLEFNITRTRHVQRAEADHREQLLHLELRLEELGYLTDRRIDPLCFHPNTLYGAFETALRDLDLEGEGKVLLLDLYAEHLQGALERLYAELNGTLSQAGFLPHETILRQAVLAREAPLADPEEGLSPRSDTSADPGAEPGLHNADGAFRPAEPSWGVIADRTARAHQPDPSSLSALASHLSPSTPEPPSPGTGTRSGTASTHPLGQVSHHVVHALTNVQQLEVKESELLDSATIKDAVRHRLEESGANTDGAGEEAWEISEGEERVIDFVNQIFISVFDDEALTDAVKALLSKLQIPVIKLALIDFAFFQLAQHPARQLLNQLVTLGARINDKSEPLFVKLKRLVDTIVEDFDTSIAPFEEALARLKRIAYVEAEQARGNEVESQQEARGQARRSAAKRTVVSTLNRHLRHRALPDEAMTFILKCWAPFMGMIYLREGTQSEKWGQSVYALRQIIEASRPDRCISEVEQLIGSADQFFAQITHQLVESSCIEKEQEGIITSTRDWFKGFLDHLPIAGLNTRRGGEQEEDDLGAPSQEELLAELEKGEAQDHDILKSLLDSIPAEVKAGTWFEIHRGTDRARRRLKLSAILEETGQVLFADRTGFSALELDLGEFLNDLREGRSKLIDDNNRFDHALNQLIDSIREGQERHQMT